MVEVSGVRPCSHEFEISGWVSLLVISETKLFDIWWPATIVTIYWFGQSSPIAEHSMLSWFTLSWLKFAEPKWIGSQTESLPPYNSSVPALIQGIELMNSSDISTPRDVSWTCCSKCSASYVIYIILLPSQPTHKVATFVHILLMRKLKFREFRGPVC